MSAAAESTHDVPHEAPTSFVSKYVFSTDHKVIARQYIFIALFWAFAGGLLAYMMRWQLAWPETPVWGFGWISEDADFMPTGRIGADVYNSLITMHGTIMVFFVAMPLLLAAMGNFLLPLMIGARDMAFPRLNMLSVWLLVVASLVLISSFFVEAGPASAGWTGYPPLSARVDYTGVIWGIDLWLLALAVEFASFLVGGINFLVTPINMRTRGMSLFRLPIMVWMIGIASLIFLLSVGPLIAGAVFLLLDRNLGTSFFLAEGGGDPLLWQHLFWFFGHPEVYVILLPALGAMIEITSTFARKTVYGYRPVIYAVFIAGILSFVVWAHHQFISGLDPRLATPFSITTILISVPFAFIMFSMLATLWKGSIQLSAAMWFALGGISVFIFGGVTGIFNGSAPVDIYIHDTLFVVAHFHSTLFSTVFLAGFGAIYYWYPKMFGRLMNETWGIVHFVGTFFGFLAVFVPMHLVGLGGMVRRVADHTKYELFKPLQPWNEWMTYAAIGLFLFQLPFAVNFLWSIFKGKEAGENPWGGTTLEWTTPSPPPHGNWPGALPEVHNMPYEYAVPGVDKEWVAQNDPAI
ncbi:MAG: cytochrome c oxidase subunit I [Nitrospinaceae bacterium]|nr:cytochrome c oxidase subunit I [Nitrospinaceae bacterium]